MSKGEIRSSVLGRNVPALPRLHDRRGPPARAHAASHHSSRVSPAGGRATLFPKLRGRILVVEDDRINQRVITYFLKPTGLETELAEDGLAAVDAIKNLSRDAVLMDCQLPRLDGLEATRRIRTQCAGQPLQVDRLAAAQQKWLKTADAG